jgi:hypothetical protein
MAGWADAAAFSAPWSRPPPAGTRQTSTRCPSSAVASAWHPCRTLSLSCYVEPISVAAEIKLPPGAVIMNYGSDSLLFFIKV